LTFAQNAVSFPGIGQENFRTLSTLAMAQEAAGKTAEAKATFDRAIAHPSASVVDLHQAGRQLMNQGKKEQAIRVWETNAKRYPNVWPVNVGLMRANSAAGKYKEALKYAKLALAQAPDDLNKRSITDAIAKLEAGKDVN
jgi:tetratricopeptide (TPR) repeat protein